MTGARKSNHRRTAFSMIETVLSVVLVGGLFIAALNTAGAAAASRREALFRAQGLLLAQDLMAEILPMPYQEPGATLLGIDLGESIGDGGTRDGFDDVDDYRGWTGTPQDKQGNSAAWGSRYTVAVDVVWVEADKPDRTSLIESGVKRVLVTVTRGGRAVATLTAYRSKSWGGRVDG
jgi:hypothetical protein